ncbi:SH3 domain-containing protein [Alphaproteobacteria bacterium LSUCC0684]
MMMYRPFLLLLILMVPFSLSFAQENRISVRGSNLEIPRFVTLKSNKVNMRSGPGREYPILWEYKRRGLPLKVIAEFDTWRKVTDHEGATGWMHVGTLSIKRIALVEDTTAKIHASAEDSAQVMAVAERGVLLEIEQCQPNWCKVASRDVKGWISRTSIWGVLENEILD